VITGTRESHCGEGDFGYPGVACENGRMRHFTDDSTDPFAATETTAEAMAAAAAREAREEREGRAILRGFRKSIWDFIDLLGAQEDRARTRADEEAQRPREDAATTRAARGRRRGG